MTIRREAVAAAAKSGARDEVRELAEALSLWRSAMHHAAARQTEHPPVFAAPPRRFHIGLVLVPLLSLALAAGVLLPLYHHHQASTAAATAATAAASQPGSARASVDDTVLMNQIDSELSEDVPDALRPLADLSEAATSTTSSSENKNVTHE